MPAQMFQVAADVPGRLWIMPCPDAMVLPQEIADYRAAGVDRVVSMLAPEEAQALGLSQEGAFCLSEGMTFHSHPIVDFGLPDPQDFAALLTRILHWLRDGKSVAVHCRAGIGRSGMVTAGVLIAMGQTAEQAMQQVTKARGVSIPDTVEQGRFLTAFAEELPENPT